MPVCDNIIPSVHMYTGVLYSLSVQSTTDRLATEVSDISARTVAA